MLFISIACRFSAIFQVAATKTFFFLGTCERKTPFISFNWNKPSSGGNLFGEKFSGYCEWPVNVYRQQPVPTINHRQMIDGNMIVVKQFSLFIFASLLFSSSIVCQNVEPKKTFHKLTGRVDGRKIRTTNTCRTLGTMKVHWIYYPIIVVGLPCVCCICYTVRI